MVGKEISQAEFYDLFPGEVPTFEDVEEVLGFLSFFPWDPLEVDDIYARWRLFDR